MQENKALSQERKKELLKDFTLTLLDSFERGEITYAQMRDAAGFILDFWKFIKTEDDLKRFLSAHSDRLSIFSKYAILSKEEEYKAKEREVIERLEKYIGSFKGGV